MNLQEQGLNEKAVLRSRHQHGSNVLAPPERESLWHKFIEKFRDPIIMILLVALLLSFGMASYEYWWVGDRDLSQFLEPLGVLLSVLLATGVAFVVLLLGLMQFFKHRELGDGLGLDLGELIHYHMSPIEGTMTTYELSFFFAFFVFLQFWNMFNAKAYRSGESSLAGLSQCHNFLLIALVILLGQVAITTFGGEMLHVVPLSLESWMGIILSTSVVLIGGELIGLFSRGRGKV